MGRFYSIYRHCCEGSALLPVALQRGSTVGKVAAAECAIRFNGGGILYWRPKHPQWPQFERHHVAVEWSYGRLAAADGSRRLAGFVALRDRPRRTTAGQKHAGLSWRNKCHCARGL